MMIFSLHKQTDEKLLLPGFLYGKSFPKKKNSKYIKNQKIKNGN